MTHEKSHEKINFIIFDHLNNKKQWKSNDKFVPLEVV